MPAKCRRNSSKNLLEEIKTMIRNKTLPEKVVQLLHRCDAEIEDAEEGCVKLLLGFRSVEGLKKFWEIYSSGEFQECLGRELSTGDIEISEEDYNRALRKLKDASDKKDEGPSPDQNLHQVSKPLPTCDPVHQKGTLKPLGFFTPTTPQVKPEGPKTLRGLSGGPSSAGQSRAIYSVDGSPFSTSGDRQSTQQRSFARSSSLLNKPSGQSSHEAAHPKVRVSSVDEDRSAGSAQFSLRQPVTSGSPDSGNLAEGRSVEGMLMNLFLTKPSKSPSFSDDDDDIKTDSPIQEEQRSASSQSVIGQGRGSATQSRIASGAGAHSISNPREMSSSQQGLGSTTWPLLNQSPNRNQPESRQPVGISSSHQGQGSTSGPLLEMSTDSYNDAERVREARNPQGSTSLLQGQHFASWPLVDLSDGIYAWLRQERRQLEMSPEKQVCCMNQMLDQQDAREDARAVEKIQPDLMEYQKELAERPLWRFENYIIYAPTGSGKTLTAAYICHKYKTWFETNVPHKHFKALFIVNMRHLTLQQCQTNAFQRYFPNTQDVQTIGEKQSFEEALKLDDSKPAVLILTAQILVNALKSNKIDIKDLDMLIFDECHHTDLKHPYKKIMKTYLKQKQRLSKPQRVGVSGPHLPFVIGLSASLGVESVDHLLTLCGNMDCKGVDRVLRNTAELKLHVHSPDEIKIENVSTPNDKQFADLLEALMTDMEDQLSDIEEHPLPPCGCQLYEAEAIRRLKVAQKFKNHTAVIIYMYLYEYNRAMMLFDDLSITDGLSHLEKFHACRLLTAHEMQDPVEEQCRELFDLNLGKMKRLGRAEDERSNEKLEKLASLLHDIFTEKPDSKGIVLLRLELATTAVVDFIRKSTLLRALPCRVIPQQFIGQEDIEDACLVEAGQMTVLESFEREDRCNVLVATDIAQEGLDMPACNFVIRYNFVSNEIGTVQSKGRARVEGSQYSLIVERLLNKKTKYDNRNKVKKMEEAMEELEAMTEDQRLDGIQEKQNKILKYIQLPKEEAEQQRAMTSLDRIAIHCKECSTLVCNASELRQKGNAGHVTCTSPEFKKWVREVRYVKPMRYKDCESVGLIICGTDDCGNQLGTMQKFLNLHPPEGYALKAQSFKIHFEMGGVKIPKMWKKAGFQILQG